MMKIVLPIFLLLTFLSIESYCQTKEETLNWIIEKINKYGDTERQTIKSISPLGLVVSAQQDFFVKGWANTYMFNLSDAIEVGNTITNQGEEVINFNTWSKNVQCINQDRKISYKNSFPLALHWKAEKNLYVRFLKAMTHLATFNEHKAKELF